ncbi:MAG: hypothetical protein ACLQU3_32735 [Limisphaerales bacterium]
MNKTIGTENDRIERTLPLRELADIASRAKACAAITENPLLHHELLNLVCAASHAEVLIRGCTEEQRTPEQEAGSAVERGAAKWRAIQEAG